MNRLLLTSFAAISLLSSGCSSSTSPPPPASNVEKLSFEFVTPPGKETHWCQYAKLPKSDSGEVYLTGHSSTWGAGIHHLLVSHTTPDLPANVDLKTPF